MAELHEKDKNTIRIIIRIHITFIVAITILIAGAYNGQTFIRLQYYFCLLG